MTTTEKKHIYGKLKQLDIRISRILQILENDDTTDTKGLVNTVRDIEVTVDNLVRDRDIQRGKLAVYGAIGAFLTLIVYWVIQALINNKIG